MRVAAALALRADLLGVQVVAADAAGALVGGAGRALIIDVVAASLAAAVVQSVTLSASLALAIVALLTDDSAAVSVAIAALTVDN